MAHRVNMLVLNNLVNRNFEIKSIKKNMTEKLVFILREFRNLVTYIADSAN